MKSQIIRFIGAAIIGIAALSGCGTDLTNEALPGVITKLDVNQTSSAVTGDVRLLGKRLIFSSVEGNGAARANVELKNTSNAQLRIIDVKSNRKDFTVVTDKSFTIQPGETGFVIVRFRPSTEGVIQGNLRIDIENAAAVEISMGGLNSKGFEGKREPNLQEIVDALGYKVDVAVPEKQPTDINVAKDDLGNSLGKARSAVGDEVLISGFTRADKTNPVTLVPLANYINRSPNDLGWFGIHKLGSKTETQNAVSFPGGTDEFGGQNQRLLPGIGDGSYSKLVPGSTISFAPNYERFGFWDGSRSNFSEDGLNDATDHAIRVYPVSAPDGAKIENAYLIADDSSIPSFKNFDYQDVVFLITNVKLL